MRLYAEAIVGMSWENTTPETIQSLHTICSRVFVAHTTQTFHPKMYFFDDGAMEDLPALVVRSCDSRQEGV